MFGHNHPGPGMGTDFMGAQFGLMNNLRTGNIILDTAICMAIPFLFGLLLKAVEQAKVWWDVNHQRYFRFGTSHEFQRVIVYEKLRTSWGTEIPPTNSWNNLLQKAVTLYLSKDLDEKRLKMHKGTVSLLTISTARANQYGYYGDDSSQSNSPADELKKYRVTCEPADDVWSEVEPGLFFMRKEVTNDDQGGQGQNMTRSTIFFNFRCGKSNGDEVIQAFLDKAYSYYQEELRKQQDSSRYFYNMISGAAAGGGGDSGNEGGRGGGLHRSYKRYKLSDEKTFRSIFFPEKENLLKILKHFQEKTGKYQIEGYPHKLGLLLHGPPGTGKTSLIKAMAAHTKRHIVSIPLSRIKTNQELMDLVFDQVFHVVGEDLPQRLKFTDVIFVMEDVDAASTIVLSRKPTAPVAATTTVTITREASVGGQHPHAIEGGEEGRVSRSASGAGGGLVLSSPAEAKVGKHDSLCLPSANSITGTPGGTTSTLKVKKEIVVASDAAASAGGDAAVSADDANVSEDEDEEGPLQGPVSESGIDLSTVLAGASKEDAELIKTLVKGDKEKKATYGKDDKLDLAGLLNVLDGVIDCPGRIVIMTSNHPEKLDEALIRPGRIDKKILLGYLLDEQAIQMIEHYFQRRLTRAEADHVKDIFKLEPKLTPAVLEQLCAEHEEIEDFLVALERQARQRTVHVHYK